MQFDSSAAGEAEVESSVIEWLLHDDQVMRECFIHAAEILKSVTGAAITAITLLDEEYQHYRAEVGMAMPLVTRARSLADYAVRDAELFVIEDAHDDARFGECMLVQRHPFVRFYAAIALRAPNGEIVGALCAMDPEPGRLDVGQRGVFYHLRAMIENDLKMRTATAIDPLTQLYNRRFLLETIARRWKEARDGDVMGSVVVDVDWFKQYNDTYGHQAGDHCLRTVASVMQAAADGERIVARRHARNIAARRRRSGDRASRFAARRGDGERGGVVDAYLRAFAARASRRLRKRGPCAISLEAWR
jgi:predicted signal transduction protein with EAL and GGDEF domain